jgi:hypothetical protein
VLLSEFRTGSSFTHWNKSFEIAAMLKYLETTLKIKIAFTMKLRID